MELSGTVNSSSETGSVVAAGSSRGGSQARLPIITLPNFDGSYERWQSFYDTFNAMVHRNTAIDTITKFHYLQSALTGKAKEYINSFEITEDNYSIVIELLKKRYHNSRLIINHHVQQLFNLPQVTRDVAGSLRALSDGLQKHTRILSQLKEPVDRWDTLLIYLASMKLDSITKREWELKVVSDKLTKFTEFIDFLETRCQMMEAILPNSQIMMKPGSNQGIKREGNKTLTHLATGNNSADCVVCHKDHRIYVCPSFSELSVEDKRSKVKALNLCFNCLGIKHAAKNCQSLRRCRQCNQKHHSLLHTDNNQWESNNIQRVNTDDKKGDVNSSPSVSLCTHAYRDTGEKLLSTVAIFIQNDSGTKIKVRALLDGGSMANFMTKNLCDRLNLKENRVTHTVSGINLSETNISSCASATIKSVQNEYRIRTEFFVTKNISQCIPIKRIDVNKLSIPDHIQLADPDFYKPQPVDILLGTNIFWDSLEPDQIKQGRGHPVLQLTKFGWILGGQLSTKEAASRQGEIFCGHLCESTLNHQLQKFWEINEGKAAKLMSAEEAECEDLFANTVKRAPDGKFEVVMPEKQNIQDLGESRANAEKRVLAMERRFKKDSQLKERYTEYVNDYLKLGHMSRVTKITESLNYLPHHAVLKEASTTTKLRVVFDASCKTSSGLALNDCLKTGPVIQQELFNIIIRFRQHAFVLTGDLVKMYRQIWIQPEQRRLQCLLWRESPDQPMEVYQLNTVTFGVTASSYLATRCLLRLAEENKDLHPNAARIIKDDFYVDDVMTGGETEEKVVQNRDEIGKILSSAGLELQKIHSNIKSADQDQDEHEITEIKTLGLRWRPKEDLLKYDSSYEAKSGIITKRIMLSAVAQIYDPLGLIGPFILLTKIHLQYLWKLKLDWDDAVPHQVAEKWNSHFKQLKDISLLNIPRHVLPRSPKSTQIHGFSDASEKAYGACIYMRTIDADGATLARLLCARSRVAPMKSLSLPRLELCGAVLLAELYSKVRESLTIDIEDIFFWSDSTITLA